MKDRNQFLEADGLYFESDTHEWFNDKSSTVYAHNENGNGVSLKNIYCFVTRDKETGEYERVVMHSKERAVIYASQSLEDIGFYIDKLKVLKAFDNE